MKSIRLKLTDEQMKLLSPIFKKVSKAYSKGKRGMALMQIYDNGNASAGFVAHDYANAIIKATREVHKKRAVRP